MYFVFGNRSTRETRRLCCRCVKNLGWAVLCCSWELITRGFYHDLCILIGLVIWRNGFGGLPSSWHLTLKIGWLWGTQPFSAILCRQLLGHGKYKNHSKGPFSLEVTMFYLNLAGEITYKQAVDVIPDGGKILWHTERLLLPKIHSLLSGIQPFH